MYHNDMKFLISKHTILGAMHMHTPHELAFHGLAVQAASTYLRPGSKSAISLGVGAGSVVKELRHRNVQVRAVEIDPTIARLARIEFGVGCSVGDGSFSALC
jgi:spermidine synthase